MTRIEANGRRSLSFQFASFVGQVPSLFFVSFVCFVDHSSGMQKKRVLILSTSAGAGHVKAGEALEKAFAADHRVEQVVHEDALKYTNKLFREFYSTLYFKLVKDAPTLLGYFYK